MAAWRFLGGCGIAGCKLCGGRLMVADAACMLLDCCFNAAWMLLECGPHAIRTLRGCCLAAP
eukprot:2702039-Lingulodinium_polyedra.AAC.1